MEAIKFDRHVQVGCGIDVHQSLIVASIQKGNNQIETREFTAYTSSLKSLRDWSKHVAMESTGIYWKPFLNILEEYFEIILVNARHVKNVPGHKTDKKDSQWLSKLLLSGLLKGSFIPPRDICELRDLVRYRKKVVAQAASDKNRIIKILEDGNIKLSSVLTNVDGAVGSKIVDSLIEGKTDIEELIQFYHGKIKVGREEFRLALEGPLTGHHKLMLRLYKDSILDKECLTSRLDTEIERATEAYHVEIDLLQSIPGVGKSSAITIISETGADMNKFPDEHHLSSWSGMSPGNNETGRKKSGKNRTWQ